MRPSGQHLASAVLKSAGAAQPAATNGSRGSLKPATPSPPVPPLAIIGEVMLLSPSFDELAAGAASAADPYSASTRNKENVCMACIMIEPWAVCGVV